MTTISQMAWGLLSLDFYPTTSRVSSVYRLQLHRAQVLKTRTFLHYAASAVECTVPFYIIASYVLCIRVELLSSGCAQTDRAHGGWA